MGSEIGDFLHKKEHNFRTISRANMCEIFPLIYCFICKKKEWYSHFHHFSCIKQNQVKKNMEILLKMKGKKFRIYYLYIHFLFSCCRDSRRKNLNLKLHSWNSIFELKIIFYVKIEFYEMNAEWSGKIIRSELWFILIFLMGRSKVK
jgi:hypothetical protein